MGRRTRPAPSDATSTFGGRRSSWRSCANVKPGAIETGCKVPSAVKTHARFFVRIIVITP
ncbi:MAG: hypothetical protein QXV75_07530 [Candidatus Bathyarchaeia archaeon]